MARKLIGTTQPVLSITFVGTIDEALYCRVESTDLVRRACGYSNDTAWSNSPEPRVENSSRGGRHNNVQAISASVGAVSHSRKRNRILEQAKKWRGPTNENAGQRSTQWDVTYSNQSMFPLAECGERTVSHLQKWL